LKLLNEARNGTEKIIDDLCHQFHWFWTPSPPLTTRRKSSFQLPPIAKQKKAQAAQVEGRSEEAAF